MPDKNPARKIRDILQEAEQLLTPKKTSPQIPPINSPLEAELLLGHLFQKNRLWLLTHPAEPVPQRLQIRFQKLVQRRVAHEPIAYILGEKEFYGRTFKITPATLIPRPETELMVEQILKKQKQTQGQNLAIWDVGTGSGAIAITLAAELPRTQIIASDVSLAALSVARQNAKRYGVELRIQFIKADLLNNIMERKLKTLADSEISLLITANLPYVPLTDKKHLQIDVTKYEPSQALFGGKDGTVVIKKFLTQLAKAVPQWKFQNIQSLFECDPSHIKSLLKYATKLFPKAQISIHRDLAGRERFMEMDL